MLKEIGLLFIVVLLFNKTGLPQPLDGLVLVFFNGFDDASYAAYDLTGQTIPANGFFVVGSSDVANVDLVVASNTVQNGRFSRDLLRQELRAAGTNVTDVQPAGLG